MQMCDQNHQLPLRIPRRRFVKNKKVASPSAFGEPVIAMFIQASQWRCIAVSSKHFTFKAKGKITVGVSVS